MHGPRLDPPERPFPAGVEDTLGQIIMWPEGIDEDTLIPEFGEITDYEEDEPDAEYDDEGIARYYGGGIRYEVTNLHPTRKDGGKETVWISEDEVAENFVPAELEPIIEQRRVAIRAQQKAQGEYNRYDNMRRAVGFKAINARRDREYQERQAAKLDRFDPRGEPGQLGPFYVTFIDVAKLQVADEVVMPTQPPTVLFVNGVEHKHDGGEYVQVSFNSKLTGMTAQPGTEVAIKT